MNDNEGARQFNPETDHPVAASFHDGVLRITLGDGRRVNAPVHHYAWLLDATPAQQAAFQIGYASLYWPDLEQSIDIETLLREQGVVNDD